MIEALGDVAIVGLAVLGFRWLSPRLTAYGDGIFDMALVAASMVIALRGGGWNWLLFGALVLCLLVDAAHHGVLREPRR